MEMFKYYDEMSDMTMTAMQRDEHQTLHAATSWKRETYIHIFHSVSLNTPWNECEMSEEELNDTLVQQTELGYLKLYGMNFMTFSVSVIRFCINAFHWIRKQKQHIHPNNPVIQRRRN